MSYRKYLAELKSTTLFQNIEDEALLALLEVMKPEIATRKAGTKTPLPMDMDKGVFCVVLKGKPLDRLEERFDVYNMPKFSEPGMMMGEIPGLSQMKKSRAPRPRPKGMPIGKPSAPPREQFDMELLLMSGEMVTAFYGEQYTKAQSIMLRNFLGILAQKVTDIRKEKAVLAAEAAQELAPYRLHVLCAGVSMQLVKQTMDKWKELHPELPVIALAGGSVDLVRACIEGDPCDLIISADDVIIRDMMIPAFADGYRVWARNKMVITGEGITSSNWEEKLLAADATFKHHNPYGDPGGYRAIMAMLLADKYKPGLSKQLMEHPGHYGMDKNPGPFGDQREAKYHFGYYSGAKISGKSFAELPAIMDLSDPALAEQYAEISFAVDDKNSVIAAPIAHGLTIPRASAKKDAAKEFAKLFLAIDKSAAGFIEGEAVFGVDPLA